MFDEMLQMRPLPSVVRFNQIMGQVAKLKPYSAVVALYNRMSMSGIRPDVYSLTIIINCLCRLNTLINGLSVLGKFFKLGFEPNVATFNTLINGFLLHNREAEAIGLFAKMMEIGNCNPDVVTFGTLIKGLCRKGNNGAAIQLLRKMEEGACKPDIVVYSTIIDSLCKDTLAVDAVNLFAEMTSKGIAPDVMTYTSLLHGVCKVGEWKQARRLLNDMVITYNMLMGGYCLRGEMDEAKEVFDLMLSKGSMVGRIHDAQNLLSQMQGCGQLPDVQTFNVLLDDLCKNQQFPKAMELLREMKHKKLDLTIVSYSILIEGMCIAGKIEDARKLFCGLLSKGLQLDVRNTIIRGFFNNNEMSRAMVLIQEMVDRDFSADASTMELIVDLLSAEEGQVVYEKRNTTTTMERQRWCLQHLEIASGAPLT
ncbi:hypothetical protein C1H46_023551 [Malus baccata]|uniref:Pentacotripeptide-repeat region of PRORP domain-containing protein n=1 Tax=Malus baccata TaxID=106549 RepID=A0A540LX80_MALBA|nr:hypothetical protein C1H46_023551 [Malus baccata]